jgi:transglutaminase-like putative cysteine protease
VRSSLRLGLELAAFAALGGYAASHWASGLVSGADDGRVLACVLIATAVGAAVALAQAAPRAQAALLRTLAAAAGIAAGLVTIGLEARLLGPRNWGELADGLDRGFAALGSVQWPYSGSEPWGATVLLLAIPLVLTVAAALAFWGRGRLRPVALVLLLALYGVAVTEHRFDGEIGRGLALLLLVAAWLWLPRMPERGRSAAIAAAGAVVLAAILAVPAAARYDDREPWVDYESWNPFAAQAATRFDWSHSYGPIDWPRDGTTLMNVRSDERHYWRVETLDRFDGFRWVPSGYGRGNNPLLPQPYREEWETSFRVTIRDLDTDLFPVAGTALAITGADPVVVPSEDGTMAAIATSLEEGDSYSVDAYVPNPTPDQMRNTPQPPGEWLPYIPDELVPYTHVTLPARGTTALDGTGRAGDAARSRALGDFEATPAQILDSPYADVLRLARRLAEGQPTPYDAVRAVQRHLRSEYTYSERPPSQEFPLAAFLFEDRIGYCQQFSGAMALMLRMLGLPARVAGGFTPGSYNRDTGEYRVRDLDAHSWVEVWFTGLGWVPFDPTPSIAPAESQSSADAASAVGGATDAPEQLDTPGGEATGALSERAGDPGAPQDRPDRAVEGWMALVALGVGAAAAALLLRLRAAIRRRGRRGPREDPDLVALRRALAGAGPVPPGLTLRALEARLEQEGDAPAARYVRMVRERRFAPAGGRPPDAPARRALRRALARGRGLRARVATYAALPPPAFRRD